MSVLGVLSVVVPLLRPPVYAEHALRALDGALPADAHRFASVELLLAEISTAPPLERIGALERNYSSFDVIWVHAEAQGRNGWINSADYRPCCAESRQCDCGDGPAFESAFTRTRDAPSRGPGASALSTALNRAARAARGSWLLLLSDLADPVPGFLSALLDALDVAAGADLDGGGRAARLAGGEPCIAGARLVDWRGRIGHAGYDLAISRKPHARRGSRAGGYGGRSGRDRRGARGADGGGADGGGGGEGGGGDDEARGDEDDTVVPFARWAGLLAPPTDEARISTPHILPNEYGSSGRLTTATSQQRAHHNNGSEPALHPLVTP